MTYREVAIQGMKQAGLSEDRIARVLSYMDTHDPRLIGAVDNHLPPELEAQAVEKATRYFQQNNQLPEDN